MNLLVKLVRAFLHVLFQKIMLFCQYKDGVGELKRELRKQLLL